LKKSSGPNTGPTHRKSTLVFQKISSSDKNRLAISGIGNQTANPQTTRGPSEEAIGL
jgi:hypothetical protein